MKSILITIFLFSIISGQRPGDKAVRAGVDAFYNYEYEKSITLLSEARLNFPEHPGVHVAWVAAHWRKDETYLPLDTIYANFERNLSEVVTVYEKLVSKYPYDYEYQLYYGSAKGLNARIYLGQKKWIPTLLSAYQGFRIIQEGFKNDPTLTDAYLPIGIVEYYAGMSNVLVKVGAEMFGLEASREGGLRKMEIAANESQWSWTESMSILSFIYQFIDINNQKGLNLSKKLSDRYPKNFDFQVHYTFSLLINNDLRGAKKQLKILNPQLRQMEPRHQKLYTSYFNFLWGYYYFKMGDYKKALGFMDKCIELYTSEMEGFLANAYLYKGMIMDQMRNRRAAVVAYKNCINLPNHYDATKLAKQYLNDPFKSKSVVISPVENYD